MFLFMFIWKNTRIYYVLSTFPEDEPTSLSLENDFIVLTCRRLFFLRYTCSLILCRRGDLIPVIWSPSHTWNNIFNIFRCFIGSFRVRKDRNLFSFLNAIFTPYLFSICFIFLTTLVYRNSQKSLMTCISVGGVAFGNSEVCLWIKVLLILFYCFNNLMFQFNPTKICLRDLPDIGFLLKFF